MASNSLYPGFVKLFYQSNAHNHDMTIPVKPFLSVGVTWFLEQKGGGGGILWTQAIDALIILLKPFFHSASSFLFAELYSMSAPDADPLFEEAYPIGVIGTAAGNAVALSQLNISYRSSEGGRANVRLMEPSNILGVNNVLNSPFTGNATIIALNNYLVSNTSIWFARDGGNLRAAIRATCKTNDQLREEFVLNV